MSSKRLYSLITWLKGVFSKLREEIEFVIDDLKY